MIKVVAKSVIKKECLEKYNSLVTKLIEETRKEKGNISYELYQDINNPCILTFIEEWSDEESLNLHLQSIHFTTIVPKLDLLRENESEINIYRLIR